MNRDQFNEWISNPGLLGQETLPQLQQLVLEYPYFQTARLLYLLNLKKLNDYRFDIELRRMAAFSGDRARLRKLLLHPERLKPSEEPVKSVSEPVPAISPVMSKAQEERLKLLEAQIKARLREIEEQQARLKKLLDEKAELASIPAAGQSSEQDQPGKGERLRALPKDDLLEEFIRERQKSGPGQVTFYTPEESARKSIEENDGIISETLARLVAAQGKYDRAIKIYQQLMLKNPQKSSYFAAQIEKLRKEI